MSVSSNQGEGASATPRDRVIAAVQQLREALRGADGGAVGTLRSSRPRRPSERDLLSDLMDAEGVEEAARKLSRFWSKAEAEVEAVRWVDTEEAEVYERVGVGSQVLQTVSVVRREQQGWRVAFTHETRDERLRVWVPARHGTIDDSAWTRVFTERHGEAAQLVVDGPGGVLGHPERGWLAELTGPFEPSEWPEGLPGEGHALLQFELALSSEPEARIKQLQWALRIIDTFLDLQAGVAAYMPRDGKLLPAQAVRRAVTEGLSPDQVARMWVSIRQEGRFFVTSGMRLLAMPELELERGALGDEESERRLLRDVATRIVKAGTRPQVNARLDAQTRTFELVRGRRGPVAGQTYGRWGALRVVEVDPTKRRGSGVRLSDPPGR